MSVSHLQVIIKFCEGNGWDAKGDKNTRGEMREPVKGLKAPIAEDEGGPI